MVSAAAIATTPRAGTAWRLAAPLALAYAAFFAAPLLLLVTVSLYDDTSLTRIGGSQWVKFLADPFYLSVIAQTLQLGGVVVAATAALSLPLALVFCASGPAAQRL